MNQEINLEECTCRTISDVRDMLSQYSNVEIYRTIDNRITVLQNDPVLVDSIYIVAILRGDIRDWQAHRTAKRYPKYGVQKGWERVTSPETGAEDFTEITDAEARQMGFPF